MTTATKERPRAAKKKAKAEIDRGVPDKRWKKWCARVTEIMDVDPDMWYGTKPPHPDTFDTRWGSRYQHGMTAEAAAQEVLDDVNRAGGNAMVSGVCRVCGCTDDDCRQCIEATGSPCEWTDATQTLCSRCAASGSGAEAEPVGPAPSRVVEFIEVPPADLTPSPTNPRRYFDQASLDSLAANLKRVGVAQPLVVRRVKKGLEIVAGERRWRAATIAGLDKVPCCVRELTDEQVLEIQIVENYHRANPRAMEEARAFRRMIDHDPTKNSAESIAATIGASPKYVWDRMKLLSLVDEAQELLEADRITAGHAILLARLKPEDQERALDPEEGGLFRNASHELFDPEEDDKALASRLKDEDPLEGKETRSVRELDGWISTHVRFHVEHAAEAAPMLFGDTKAKVDEAQARPGKGKKVVPITYEYRVPDEARDEAERTYGSESWQRADGQRGSKTCEHSVLGVVAAGARYGQAFEVCVARDRCAVHFADSVRAKQKRERAAAAGLTVSDLRREKEAAEQREREREAAQRQKDEEKKLQALRLFEKARPRLVESIAASVKKAPIKELVKKVLGDLVGYSDFGIPSMKEVNEARRLLKAGDGADDAFRIITLAPIVAEAEQSWCTFDMLCQTAGKYGGGLKQVLAAVEKEEAATVKKAAKLSKPGAKAKKSAKRAKKGGR